MSLARELAAGIPDEALWEKTSSGRGGGFSKTKHGTDKLGFGAFCQGMLGL